MPGDELGFGGVLAAAEDVEPAASVDVVARRLHERYGARSVSFLFVDLFRRELVRLIEQGQTHSAYSAERVRLQGSDYDTVLRTQELRRVPDGDGGLRVIAPVTNRGDTIGVLELTLPDVGDDDDADVLEEIRQTAHALAYIIIADRRFTDLYQWGRRTTPVSLAAEIQHQLLPSASCCEAPQFTLAGTLLPADTVAGDTFDYTLDRETLHLSVTDAMGHDVIMANSSPGCCCASAWTAAASRSSTPGIPGRCGCAAGPCRRWSWPSIRPSGCPIPRTFPTAFRNSTCAPVTGWCCTPTACKTAAPRQSTCPRLSAAPVTCIRGRPSGSWPTRSLTPATGSSPTTPPSCAWTGTAPGLKPGKSAGAGRRTVNVLPRPSALSTVIVPWCAATMALVMVSPRPVPWISCRLAIAVR
jgi:hypothetical protein